MRKKLNVRGKTDWIVTHDGSRNPMGHQCLRCGAYHKLEDRLPMLIDEFIKIGKAFINLHKHCGKPTLSDQISEDYRTSHLTGNFPGKNMGD